MTWEIAAREKFTTPFVPPLKNQSSGAENIDLNTNSFVISGVSILNSITCDVTEAIFIREMQMRYLLCCFFYIDYDKTYKLRFILGL